MILICSTNRVPGVHDSHANAVKLIQGIKMSLFKFPLRRKITHTRVAATMV